MSFENGSPQLVVPMKMKPSLIVKAKELAKFDSLSQEDSKECSPNSSDCQQPLIEARFQKPDSQHSYLIHDKLTTQKRRSNVYRENRMSDDVIPTEAELEMEKQYLKSQYSFAPG